MHPRPALVISELDATRLEALLLALPDHAFAGRAALEEELARADIREPQAMPPNVVTMNSTVRFRMSSSSQDRCLTLVYPQDVSGAGDTVSILAPVGSALLGLAQGDEIEWPRPDGGSMRVLLEEVVYQPERAGDFHL